MFYSECFTKYLYAVILWTATFLQDHDLHRGGASSKSEATGARPEGSGASLEGMGPSAEAAGARPEGMGPSAEAAGARPEAAWLGK